MKNFFLLLTLFTLFSCQSSIKQIQEEETIVSSIEKSSNDKTTFILNDSAKTVREAVETKPNDGFRTKVLPSLTNNNDVKIFNKILDKLDQKQVSLCSVIKKLFTIDDQCLAVARRKFPDASQQESFSKMYSESIKREYGKYGNSINLSREDIGFINTAYAFHEPVKSFCGRF